jgi:DtxR family transcriptional regulator, Mn-dependent transcriptional regulator
METGNGLEISPRKVAYLKYIYERGDRVKTNEMAVKFNVDPSTITKTLSELTGTGMLSYEPYRGVHLTKKGKTYAEFLVKRHRILSLMLTHYGLSQEQACDEAKRFESFVSRDAIDRMCIAMGHPCKGICGEITHDDGCMDNEKKSGRVR